MLLLSISRHLSKTMAASIFYNDDGFLDLWDKYGPRVCACHWVLLSFLVRIVFDVAFCVGCLGILAVGFQSILLAALFPIGVCVAVTQNMMFLMGSVWQHDNTVPWALDYKILRRCRCLLHKVQHVFSSIDSFTRKLNKRILAFFSNTIIGVLKFVTVLQALAKSIL